MTQTANKGVPVLSMWCDGRQETVVNVDLFPTTTNYSSFLSLCLVMSFHSILLQRRGLGPFLCYVMGLNESNHFSGVTSAFRASCEQRNLKVGLISAFDRHTSINRSISTDHALDHALQFGGEWRNLKKVSSFHYLTMYLNSFVP